MKHYIIIQVLNGYEKQLECTTDKNKIEWLNKQIQEAKHFLATSAIYE